MGLAMSDDEILTSFKNSEDRQEQLNVLAELNGMYGSHGRKVIQEVLLRAGLPKDELPKPVCKHKMDREKARALYAQGLDDYAIAGELHCHYQTVGSWRRQNDLPSHVKRGGAHPRADEVEEAPKLAAIPLHLEDEPFFDDAIVRDMKALMTVAGYATGREELDLVRELMCLKLEKFVSRKLEEAFQVVRTDDGGGGIVMGAPKKCPECGANLDAGEICDCQREASRENTEKQREERTGCEKQRRGCS